MPSLHRRLRNRRTRMLVQLGAMTTGIVATLLIANDEPATRAIGTAVLATIAIVAIKLALVAINPPGQGTSASADQRSKFDEIAARIGALETLDSWDGNPIDRSATTHFESQHVPNEVDRLQAEVDEIIARIGVLEALSRSGEAAIASLATTQFELQHVREELDRLRSQVD